MQEINEDINPEKVIDNFIGYEEDNDDEYGDEEEGPDEE